MSMKSAAAGRALAGPIAAEGRAKVVSVTTLDRFFEGALS